MSYRIYLTALICVAAGSLCAAQNIDPTVEVSRAYEGKLLEVHKPLLKMACPDSVNMFNLKFDYSVFDNPFKGSYEFSPYMLNMRPEPEAFDGRTFYFRAGAGYRLRPSADIVWSPLPKGGNSSGKRFRMSVYGTHRSYVGDLPRIALSNGILSDSRASYNGYDTYTDAGTEGRLEWKGGKLEYDFGYRGIAAGDTLLKKHFDAFRGSIRVSSLPSQEAHFIYDVSLGCLLGEDKVSSSGQFAVPSAGERNYTLGLVLGKVFRNSSSFTVELGSRFVSYPSWNRSFAGQVSLTPRYRIGKGRWNADLGIRLDALFYDDRRPVEENYLHSTRGQFAYPDIELGWDAVKSAMNIYLKATGGNTLNTYTSLLASNPHFSSLYAAGILTDNTVERINACLGFRGNISSRFSYDLRGGYSVHSSFLSDAVIQAAGGLLLPAVAYSGCRTAYASLDFAWESNDISMKGNLAYRHCCMDDSPISVFAPSAFTAHADVIYNWNRRIYAGIHCAGALKRDVVSGPLAGKCSVPGYADLGISAQWRFSKWLSFWLYGGNLLNMPIQRIPLCPEGGISCTVGVCIVL